MPNKIYVLLSGGIDSTTALAMAKLGDFPHTDNNDFEAVTIDYGQRHAREIEAAKEIADFYHVPHVVIDAKGFMEGMLVDKGAQNEAVPDVDYADLPKGISPTYVTFRNGLMLSILAARAQAWVMQQQRDWKISNGAEMSAKYPDGWEIPAEEEFNAYIYCGIHADDGVNWAYPDCTQEFIGPMAAAIYTGTYNRVRVRSPFTFMPKSMLVMIGSQFGVPYSKTWSCYKGEEKHCGTCPTCRSRKDAFTQVGMKDPTVYAA